MEIIDNLSFFREINNYPNCGLEHDHNIFEYEQDVSPPVLKGRLRARCSFWESINTNSFVLDIIKHGYRIPFINTPVRVCLANNKSALEHRVFVEAAISELLRNLAAVEVPFIPHVVNPLSVSIQSSGKKRLILDLRHVNQCIFGSRKSKFKRMASFKILCL
jgi:hypothetical protein